MYKIIEYPKKNIEIVFSNKVYPFNVFNNIFDIYCFLPSDLVACSDDEITGVFSKKMYEFQKDINSNSYLLGTIDGSNDMFNSFEINNTKSNISTYDDCLSFDIDGHPHLGGSPYPIFAIPENDSEGWALYGELVGCLSVIGLNNSCKDSFMNYFKDIIVEDKEELFFLYKTSKYRYLGDIKADFQLLCSQYKI